MQNCKVSMLIPLSHSCQHHSATWLSLFKTELCTLCICTSKIKHDALIYFKAWHAHQQDTDFSAYCHIGTSLNRFWSQQYQWASAWHKLGLPTWNQLAYISAIIPVLFWKQEGAGMPYQHVQSQKAQYYSTLGSVLISLYTFAWPSLVIYY